MTNRVVIVGAGHAAGQLATSLAQHAYDGPITVVGNEAYLPYQRPPLSKKFLAGEMDVERLYVRPESFYEEAGIEHAFVHVRPRAGGRRPQSHQRDSADSPPSMHDHLPIA